MALDPIFLDKFQNSSWFKSHPAALAIVKDGAQQISSNKPAHYNLQCLLSNMCAYGKRHWRYEPGSRVSAENTLRGTHPVTDCASLAKIFCEIAIQLGYNAVPRKIERDGYRIVTKPGMATFKGEFGDESIDGRWCFGDHWVAQSLGLCYDPTFKIASFSFGRVADIYLGWYAKEVRDKQVFTGTYWQADPAVSDSRHIYMLPNAEYTYKRVGNDVKM